MSNSKDYAVFKLCCCNGICVDAQIFYRFMVVLFVMQYTHENIECTDSNVPGIKVHGATMGPTRVLSAPDGPNVGPVNLAIKVYDLLLSEWGRIMNLYFHCRLYRPYTRCNITHRYTMYLIRYWHASILLSWLVTAFWSLDLCAYENIQDLMTKLQHLILIPWEGSVPLSSTSLPPSAIMRVTICTLSLSLKNIQESATYYNEDDLNAQTV